MVDPRQQQQRMSQISMDEDFEPEQNGNQTDGPQQPLSMKDQEQMLQELKKENFDLKLRLYMTQKNSETAEEKASEYEQQLAALLNNLEDQQQLSEQQTRDLNESRAREKRLQTEKNKLQVTCQQQDEKIHNLSLSLSKLSTSMHDVSSPKYSTPMRSATSAYFPDDEDHDDSDVRPLSPTQRNVSHVAPMRRGVISTSSFNDESTSAGLMSHDRGVHHSVSESTNYHTSTPVTKNYYNTSLDNRHNQGFDNVGIVRPNNTRTVVDVEIPDSPTATDTPKKKKKGIMKVFKLCTGKSGENRARQESMYHKKEPAKITMTTYNE